MANKLNETAQKFLRSGCLIGAQRARNHPAWIEISDGRLRWINCFPADQHHTHELEFNRIVDNGAGLGFYQGDRLLAYLAKYSQWPEEPIDDYREEKARWEIHLQEEENRKAFDEFVSQVFG